MPEQAKLLVCNKATIRIPVCFSFQVSLQDLPTWCSICHDLRLGLVWFTYTESIDNPRKHQLCI